MSLTASPWPGLLAALDGARAGMVASVAMRDLQDLVAEQLSGAVVALLGPEYAETDPLVRPADPKHGDYQANLALPLAKRLGRNPRELAQALKEKVEAQPDSPFESVNVAGPGFVNFRLRNAEIAKFARGQLRDPVLGMPRPARAERVIVDYGSPNVAKEMHVGHLRTTVIGDAIVRVLRFAGHEVVPQNHLGDWGTQFGMLLEHLIDLGWDRSGDHAIEDLDALYREAKQCFDADEGFRERARKRVVTLQAGDEESLSYWRKLIDESCSHMNENFRRLGIVLTDADIRGESFFNSRLPAVLEDLSREGIVEESDGAQVAFCEGFKGKTGEPLPLMVRKSDGGFGYAATDLAAGRFRIEELGATRLVYVVDARQSDHFAMLFATLRKAGWASDDIRLEHVAYGTIQDENRKPFKTREGDTVKLSDLLEQAVERARSALGARERALPSDELDAVAEAVGISAAKYADLSSDRVKDYIFSYERMLAMEGNTAPYLQYACVRLRSILRRGGVPSEELLQTELLLDTEPERALSLSLLRFRRVVEQVVESLEPHRLCGYLYDVASAVHQFNERCPVLKAESPALVRSRLALSELAARTLAQGLELLGVVVPARM